MSSTSSRGSADSRSASKRPASARSASASSTRSVAPSSGSTGPGSPSTTTSGPSQPSLFPGCEPKPLEELASSAVASRASTSPSPAEAPVSRERAPAFGANSPGLWKTFDPLGHSLRTWLLSEFEASTGSPLTWRARATPSGRFWWVLERLSELPTGESGSSSSAAEWFSPQARDWKDSGPTQGRRHSPNLGTQVWRAGSGAPAARTSGASGTASTSSSAPVPRSKSGRSTPTSSRRAGRRDLETSRTPTAGKCLGLNSRWWAQLMGFPSDWCELADSELDELTGSRSRPMETPSSPRSSRRSAARS